MVRHRTRFLSHSLSRALLLASLLYGLLAPGIGLSPGPTARPDRLCIPGCAATGQA